MSTEIGSAITVDEQLQSKLAQLTQVTEFRAPDGRLVGTFTPAAAIRGSKEWEEQYRRARALFDPEEIERRKSSNEPCLSLREVMQHLNSLEPR